MSEQPATESLSIEDRLYAQFEPEQPEVEAPAEQQEQTDEAAAESEAQPEFVDVEYEGKAYQVPPELKDAILRQSDYTKKTTEAAERQRALEQKELQIRAAESERAFHEKAKDDVTQIQKIDFQIEQWKAVDVSALDAKQLWQLKAQIDDLKEKRNALTNGLNQKWQEHQQEQTKLQQEATSKYVEALTKAIPTWSQDLDAKLTQYAVNDLGMTPEELSRTRDVRFVKALHKAYQFDQLKVQNKQGKVTTVPTVKPGSSNPMPQHVKDQFALKKQLSSAKTDAQKAKVIERELMNRF